MLFRVRRFRAWGVMLIGCILVCAMRAAESESGTRRAGEGGPLEYDDAIVLGLVEGITEFLPVSSTGHLVLANHFLDLDRDVPARDQTGALLWIEEPARDGSTPGRSFTVKAAADTCAVVIQGGAILAVAVVYWRTILAILAGMIGRNPAGLLLLRNLLVAFIPAVVLGLALDDFIDEHLFSVPTVAAALVVGAVIMLAVSRWQRTKAARLGDALPDPALSDLSVLQSLGIGFLQALALWPGMSRSMIVIVGGYVMGLRPARAAEFSFLLGLPTLAGASAYKAMGTGPLMLKAFGAMPLLLGGVVAAVSAGVAVRWLVGYLNRHGLALFAWYRLLLATVVIVWWARG